MSTESPTHANATGGQSKSFTRFIPPVVRILMGLMFLVFGLNGFFWFIPPPKDPGPEAAAAFIGALMKTGYLMPLVSGTQVLVGALLLLNRFVPLALALITPILVGIITFHLFLAPAGTAPGLVLFLMDLYLAWAYRTAFRPMLAARVKPG
jgi:uncharacterized membrane protein YphA (DoxX/SURF4 family)